MADTAWTIVQSRDRVALIAVGTVAPGTVPDTTQPVLGKFVVPRASVTFAGSVQPECVYGDPADTTPPSSPAGLRSTSVTNSRIDIVWDASTD